MATTITDSDLNTFVNQAATMKPIASTASSDVAPSSILEASGVANSQTSVKNDTDFLSDAGDEPVIISGDSVITAEDVNSSDDEDIEKSISEIIADQMIDMRNSNADDYASSSNQLITEIVKYRKQLMVKDGFTAAEADEAAKNRARRHAQEANTKYMEEHPDLAVIKVDKTNADKLEFSEEEKEKIVRAKAIRIVEVTDEALKTVKIKKGLDEKYRYDAIHRTTCNVSKYELPLLNTFDKAEFAGSQTVQLVNAVYDANESEYIRTKKQISLAYDRFLGSTGIDKYDIDGNVIFTEEDFANWLAYPDLETAIYAIYVASSTEEITSTFQCDNEPEGENYYKCTYNTKKLINYDDIPENFKQDLNSILGVGNADDRDEILRLKSNSRMTKRIKSMFTNNIYDISIASCARALSILRWVNPKDPILNYVAPFAMMTERVLVYDPTDGEYLEISAKDDPKALIIFYRDMVEQELKIIANQMKTMFYSPSFKLDTVCDKCGKKHSLQFRVEDLVFLKTQSTEEEIL